jgi:transposase
MSMFRQTGDVDSHAKFGGHKKAKLAGHEQTIVALLTKQPDITLQALTALLVEKNVHTSETGLFFFLKALGFGYKKNGIWGRTETEGRSGTKRNIQKASKRA